MRLQDILRNLENWVWFDWVRNKGNYMKFMKFKKKFKKF